MDVRKGEAGSEAELGGHAATFEVQSPSAKGAGMDLMHKYLVMVLTDTELCDLFALPQEPDRWWYLGGRIEGETPALGLWVKFETIVSKASNDNLLAGTDFDKVPHLVPWAFVRRARLYKVKPPTFDVGFKPR